LFTDGLKTSAYRKLAPNHPVRALIEFSTENSLWSALFSRRLLLGNGFADKTSSLGVNGVGMALGFYYATWHWLKDVPELQIQSRNISGLLPHFDYFQDALAYAAALRKFARNFLSLHYASDADVVNDNEIQAWAADLASPAHGAMKGFPASFATLDQLAETLAHIAYVCTVFHLGTAHNLIGTLNLPYQPSSLFKPVPSEKGVPLESVIEWLPTFNDAIWATAFSVALSQQEPTEADETLYHGIKQSHLFNGKTKCAISALLRDLDTISAAINERASTTSVLPYTILDPHTLPHSIIHY